MSTEQPANDERLPIVKSREVQRATLAEMAGDSSAVARHFLAAAHLELVLAEDYAAAGAPEMSLRSRISAASCFWRAGPTLPLSLRADLVIPVDFKGTYAEACRRKRLTGS